MACVSSMIPGPEHFVLYRALPGGEVVGAVAKIDLTPIPTCGFQRRASLRATGC